MSTFFEISRHAVALAQDNGGENQGDLVAWCERHRVVILRNLPHTPEHNPWIEHGFGELKAQQKRESPSSFCSTQIRKRN